MALWLNDVQCRFDMIDVNAYNNNLRICVIHIALDLLISHADGDCVSFGLLHEAGCVNLWVNLFCLFTWSTSSVAYTGRDCGNL